MLRVSFYPDRDSRDRVKRGWVAGREKRKERVSLARVIVEGAGFFVNGKLLTYCDEC